MNKARLRRTFSEDAGHRRGVAKPESGDVRLEDGDAIFGYSQMSYRLQTRLMVFLLAAPVFVAIYAVIRWQMFLHHRPVISGAELLLILPLLAIAPIAILIVTILGLLDDSLWAPAAILAGLAIAEAVLLRDYLWYRLQFGPDGITEHRFRKQSFIPYEEITDCREENGDVSLATTEGRRLRFRPGSFAYGSRILPLIEENRRRAGASSELAGRAGDIAVPTEPRQGVIAGDSAKETFYVRR